MNSTLTRVIVLLAAALVLAAVNYSIYAKEQITRHGEPIYLPLAPVDPRSLMQGDYMALRFQLAAQVEESLQRDRAPDVLRVPVTLDERHVATLATNGTGELSLRYRIRDGQVWLGTNAYFFEEGAASRFSGARYGEFRVDRASGEAVLVGLRDADLRAL